jgi:hypothetical protein
MADSFLPGQIEMAEVAEKIQPALLKKPPELSWPEYLLLLLHIAAEIEHALMVQYLFAAYALDERGAKKNQERKKLVQSWRRDLLIVAREEMGHLLCVQNAICLLGGPITLERQDFPWGSHYYPFAFHLEPLNEESLACYVYAEMPSEEDLDRFVARERRGGETRWQRFREDYKKKIKPLLEHRWGEEHHVGELYQIIMRIAENQKDIPASAFHRDTAAFQSTADEWNKLNLGFRGPGGGGGERVTFADRPGRVIVRTMSTRGEALRLLSEVAGQGEAPHFTPDHADEPSHFDRFYKIFREFHDSRANVDWYPSRNVARDPTTFRLRGVGFRGTYIKETRSRLWANLFNLRYRILLSYLAHSYRLPRAAGDGGAGLRGSTLQRAFKEMLNLKTIAGILVDLPLGELPAPNAKSRTRDKRRDRRRLYAGPPFEMPYTLALPVNEADCWLIHKDLHETSRELCRNLLQWKQRAHRRRYLRTLRTLDRRATTWIDKILAGLDHALGHAP